MTFISGITSAELDRILSYECVDNSVEVEEHGFLDSIHLLEQELDSGLDQVSNHPEETCSVIPFIRSSEGDALNFSFEDGPFAA